MNTNKDPNEKFLVSFSDILSILRQSAKKILCCALVFGVLGVLWVVIKPIRYQAEGTFRERGIKQSTLSPSSSLIHLLNNGSGFGGTDSEAAFLMISRAILKDVIEKLHLQAHLQLDNDAETLLKLIRSNLTLAWVAAKSSFQPILKEICCPLKLESLKYTGELPLAFKIELQDDGRYHVYHPSSKELIGQGKLGEPFHFNELFLVLASADHHPLLAQSFSLSVNSLANTVQYLSKAIKIEPAKQDKSLLQIKFEHRNRHIASAVVNAVMESYQSYSKKYHTEMALRQLDYLSERRDQLTRNLTDLMQKHADFLANDLYSSGLIESNKEMDFLARSQHEYKRKLLDNELEVKRLTSIKPDNFAHYERYSANEGDPVIINNIFSEMRTLKQQRDGLEIEMQKKAINQGANLQQFFEQQLNELKEVQEYLAELREISYQFQQGNVPDRNSKLINDPRFLLIDWFERLKNAQLDSPKASKEARENFQFYLNNLERLFGVHERILQERLTHQQNPSGEYQGINLEVATDLYRDYSKQLIQMESVIRQNVFFIHQIEDPHFEITSLSAGLNDPISSEIIRKASQLVLNLRDQNNQSLREQERIKEELTLERTFLTLHLQQMVQLMELNKQLIDEKIFALQNVSLELIHQRISLLEKNLQDYLQSRLHNLQQERTLIKRHLENIHAEMAQLPQKWVSEQLLTQEVATNHLIVEEIAKLVETKNISHNLEVIQSAPIDLALSPVYPLTPKVVLLGFLGFFIGGCLGSCFVLARSLSHGLKVSAHYLEQMGSHISGVLTSPLSHKKNLLQEGNLETLRRLQVYFDSARLENLCSGMPENKLLLLIQGNGPDYAPFLANLFVKRGRRVLILDLNFNQTSTSFSPGILQYLEGKIDVPFIQKGEHGDWMAAGGTSLFVSEMIASSAFQKLIDQLKPSYDWILAVSRAAPGSVEAESLIPSFPFAVLTLTQEKVEELNFYIQFLKMRPHYKISFILNNSL